MRGTWSRGKWGRWRAAGAGLSLGLLLWTGGASAQAQQTASPPVPAEKLATQVESDLRAMELLSRGATLDEVASILGPRVKNPQDAIRELKTGNARFFSGEARRPEMSATQHRAQIYTQTPFAAVLSCADSRVPTEIVYDQRLGDIFTTRVAGNVVTPSTAGSLEYAVLHLKPRVVVVMGHEGCGAVHAALSLPAERHEGELPAPP